MNRIHNFGRAPWRPVVLYDVFKNADVGLRVVADRPKQLTLPTLNYRLVGTQPLLEGKPSKIIFADFHYAELEESA